MITINLLPWRTEERRLKQQQFFIYLGLIISTTIVFCSFMHFYFAHQLKTMSEFNLLLEKEIAEVDEQITAVNAIKEQKNDLISQLTIIHALQANRIELVSMFNNFVEILPPGIYLTDIEKKGQIIHLAGQARNNQQISILMEHIDHSKSFLTPNLTEITDTHEKEGEKKDPLREAYPIRFALEIRPEISIDASSLDKGPPSLNTTTDSSNESQ